MTAYTPEELRSIFQRPFDRTAWKAISQNIFRANKLRTTPEHFTCPDDAEQGYYMGSVDTPDNFQIGLFYYEISSGSVAHKKVGLRNLVKKFVNPMWGDFDAAIVVFSDGKEWRLSLVCDVKDVATTPKRFTYVFGEHDNLYRTAIERFTELQKEDASFANIRKAFSVDALSDDFFEEYRELYADFVEYITGKRYVKEGGKYVERKQGEPDPQYDSTFDCDDKLVRDYVKKMFGRIVFLYFLQRKGWLNGNRRYMHDLFALSNKKDNFLDGVLEPLFFEVLNTDKPYRTAEAKSLPGCENIPYLNGGLFAKDNVDDRTCIFPERLFSRLFDFLDSYNFTIDENDTDDAEIGIDPEMLGRIFENLLEDNKDKGAFYTPKEIVSYMCNESIIAYLTGALPEIDAVGICELVENLNPVKLSDKEKVAIRRKLQSVKICDPAIGSGAFPMGLVNILSKLYVAMKADTDTSKMKRHIMEQNIYGVDIEKGAVDIARLRFWLAMIVEEKEPMPLPNLHFKIMQGNSLLESYNGIDLSDLTKVNTIKTSLFDSEDSEREDLVSALKLYYKTSDHSQRKKLFNEITDNVRRQLLSKEIILPSGMDPSANADFFLWHTWFTDVFANGGFDIVIGNPPYISTKGVSAKDKKLFMREYGFSDDTYNHFFFRGLDLCKKNGCLTYITPKTFWTTQTKRNLRDLILSNTLITVFDTANPFSTAMVDTCVTIIKKAKSESEHTVNFLDGTESLKHPFVFAPILQSVYERTQNSVIFKPTELNMKIWSLYGEKVKELYDKWWNKIKTSRDIEKNKAELEDYRRSLKPGDIALLGCLTEGGQGLATANNGKYIAVRRSTKWANNIVSSRPKKLTEVVSRYNPTLPGYIAGQSMSEYLSSLSESEIATLFDNLKEQYGRDIFGQGYLYKIIEDSEIADVSTLTDDEKENGIDPAKNYYVPYDKGDKDGNRWYLETPFAIAWSKENVHFLKTNPKARYQGYKFYFREGFCWNNVLTTYLKCKKKERTVQSTESMSFFSCTEQTPEYYLISIMNSRFTAFYVDNFVNSTSHCTSGDAKLIPIVIPTIEQLYECKRIFDKAFELKKSVAKGITTDLEVACELTAVESANDLISENIYQL